MKRIITTIVAVLLMVGLFFAFTPSPSTSWTLDQAHAKLGFTVTHMMVSEVDGMFKKFDIKLSTEKEDFSDASVSLTAVVASISTENEKRDADLKSSSYFDAAKYPLILFESKTFTKLDEQHYKVSGNLTMHGVTRPVVLNALCRMGTNPKSKSPIAGFKVTGKVKRLDFGIGETTPSAIISDEVDIVANVEFGKTILP